MSFPWSYTEAVFKSPFPLGPVSGFWTPSISTEQHSSSASVTASFAAVDAEFHKPYPLLGYVRLSQVGLPLSSLNPKP